jgi:hypothetical protein
LKPRRNRPPARSSKPFVVNNEMAKDMANYVLGLMSGNPVHLHELSGEDQRIIEEWLRDKNNPRLRDRAWTVIEVLKIEHPVQKGT